MKGFKRINRTTALFMAVFLLISSFTGSFAAFGAESTPDWEKLDLETALGQTVTPSAVTLGTDDPEGETVVEWRASDEPATVPDPATGGANKEGAAIDIVGAEFSATSLKGNYFGSKWKDGVGTKYFQLNFSSKDFRELNLTFSYKGSATSSPKDFDLEWSADGENFSKFGEFSVRTITSSEIDTGNFGMPEGAWDKATVYIRFVLSSLESCSGGTIGLASSVNLRDIIVTGTQGGTSNPEVNKDELNAAITSAQVKHDTAVVGTEPGQYPEAAKTAFANAIAATEAVRDDESADQSQVDAALSALNTAVQAFEDSEIKEDVPSEDPISDAMVIENGAITVKEAATKQSGQSYKVIGQVAYMFEKSDSFGNASIIIQDIVDGEVYGLMIYRGVHAGLEPGDIITVQGSHTIFNGLPEVNSGSTITKIGHADPIAPQVLTISEINANGLAKYVNEYVQIKDVTLPNFGGDHTYISDATGMVDVYRSPQYPSGAAAGTKVDVFAAVSRYSSTIQLRIGESSDYVIKDDGEANKDALIAAITSAQAKHDAAVVGAEPGQYPQAAKTAFAGAIAAAIAVRDNASATQVQVDDAVTALNGEVETFEASVIETEEPVEETVVEWRDTPVSSVLQNVAAATGGANKSGASISVVGALFSQSSPDVGFSIAQWQNGAGTKYCQITFSSKDFKALKLTADAAGTRQMSPRDFVLQYSTDGTNFTEFGNYAVTAYYNPAFGNYDFSSIGTFDLPQDAWNKDMVYVRFMMSSNIGMDGTSTVSTTASYLKNITVTGTDANEPVEGKDALIAAIDSAQAKHDAAVVGTEPGQYPQAAKTDFANAITAAIAVRDDEAATQEQVDAAVAALNTAVQTFEASEIEETSADPISDAMVIENGAITVKEAATKQSGQSYKVIGQVAYMFEKSDSFGNASIIIQDIIDGEVYGLMIYRGVHAGLEPGDIIVVQGSHTIFNGLPEVNSGSTITKIGHADPIAPQVLTISEINANGLAKYVNEYVQIKDVTLPNFGGDHTYISDATGMVDVYRSPQYPSGAAAGTKVDVFAAVSRYSSTVQLRMGESSDYVIKDDGEVDKAALIAAIDSAQEKYDNAEVGTELGQYPEAAKTAFGNAIAAAKAVRDNTSATQSQVNIAVETLNAAVNTFEYSKIAEDTPGDPISDAMVIANGAITVKEAATKQSGQSYKVIGQVAYIHEKDSSYGNALITIQDIIDGEIYGFLIYRGEHGGLVPGDIITAQGSQNNYQGLPEMGQGSVIAKIGHADPIPPQELTIAEINANGLAKYVNEYVHIIDVTLGDFGGQHTYISDGTGTVDVYNSPPFPSGATKGTVVDVFAQVSRYNSTIQLRMGESSDYVIKTEIDQPPVISTVKLNNAIVDEDYPVALDVTDDNGVESVSIRYAVNGGSQKSMDLALNESMGKYEGTISGEEIAETGFISINAKAVDSAGKTTEKSFEVVITEYSELNDPIPDSEPGERGALDINEALATPIGQTVKVMGQVTYSYAGNAFLIQDVIGGSVIGYQLYAPPENLEIGDIVIAEGKVADFYTLPELGNIDSITFIRKEAPIPPQVVTISQLTSSTAYVNQYVRINNVILGSWIGEDLTTITDSAGQSAQIYRAAEYPIGTKAGDVVDILAAGSIHNNSIQLRTNSPKDYIIKNDTMAPVITPDDLLPAKVGVDYRLSVKVEDNVDVDEVKLTYTIGGTTREITLELNEINGKYQGVIPGGHIAGADSMELSFTATDVNGNTTPEPVTVSVEIVDKPQIESVQPAANSSYLAGRRPEFKVVLQNAGNDPEVKLSVNGGEEVDMNVEGNVATWTPDEELPEGEITAQVTVTREDGVKSDPYSWNFYIGERDYNFYFGQIHSHSNYSDGAGTPEEAMAYAANAYQIDWFALTDHSNYFDTAGNLGSFDDENSGLQMTYDGQAISKWKRYKDIVEGAASDDFLPIYGFEMTWSNKEYGHMNTYNTEGFLSRNHPTYNTTGGAGLQAYYEALAGLDTDSTFSQFNHPGATFGNFSNFAYYDSEYDKAIDLIEVGNGDGPIQNVNNGYWPSYEEYPKALDKGWHLAPSNNQDNHRKRWGDSNTTRTVAVAGSLDKESIIGAVKNHSVYATEDNNFEVFYTVNGSPMGTIFDSSPEILEFIVDFNDPDFTDDIQSITVRGTAGNSVYAENPGVNQGRLEFEISNDNPYYYLDIVQLDGDRIVTAPVWVEPFETIDAGISKVEKNTEKEYLGKPVTITTTIFNNEAQSMNITKISYKFLGEVLNEKTEDLPNVVSGSTVTDTFEFAPTYVGKNPVLVEVTGIINGEEMTFSSEILIDVELSEEDLEVTDISEVHEAEEGKPFAIEGYLTSHSNGYDTNIAFFDSAYIQDETGGINIFPINEYKIGDRLRIEGMTSSYQGEHQLNVVNMELLDGVKVYEPDATEIADVPGKLGKLIKVTGTVESVGESNDLIETIVLNDGEGSTIRVFIDGYIGGTLADGTTADVNNYIMPEIKEGDTVEAAGLSSIDTDGNRIRVRDRSEITVKALPGQVSAPESNRVSGTYIDKVEVTLTSATEDAKIYYTLDGSIPTASGTLYTGTLTFTEYTVLKAVAVKEDMTDSTVSTFTYIIDGDASLAIGGEKAGGAGYAREINIEGISDLDGKYLVVKFTEGSGVSAKVSIVMIDASPEVTISYQKNGTKIEAWLTSGMPDLIGDDMKVDVLAYDNTN